MQVPQNGSDTLEIKPISPFPSAKRNRSAGAVSAGPESGSRGQTSEIRSKHLAAGHELAPIPLPCASSGMNSMKRTMRPVVPGEGGEVEDLVVVLTTEEDHVDLEGSQTGALGRVHRVENDVEVSPAANGGEPFGPQRVAADVDSPQPGRGQLGGDLARSVPLVVMARSSNPSADETADERGSPLRTSGSPPVMRRAERRDLRHPRPPG